MLFWFSACIVDRTLVQVPVREVPSPASFTLEDGTSITLDHATIGVGNFRFEGPASASWRLPNRLPSLVSSAWAHPGHDFAGQVGGELLGTFEIDLLGEPEGLATADCFEGIYATARFDLVGPVSIAGTATVDGEQRAFDFTYEADGDISGVAFEGAIDPALAQEAVLAVDLSHVLGFVDWRTPDDDGDGVLTLSDGLITNTFSFGVHSTASFSMTLEST